MGFEKAENKGTSHEHYKKVINDKLYKVTVDCPKAPFSNMLLDSMARQAGISKRQLIAMAKNKKLKGHPLEK